MIGQDAVRTAEAFRDGVGFDGVVLAKLDGDARGGAALSIAQVTGRQILFASNGEKLTDFDVFHPERMASRILGMGDMLTLIEKAEQAFDSKQAEEMAAKLQSGTGFTLEDFLSQMQAVRKMGSFSKLLGMLPGAAGMREQIDNLDDRELDRVEAIIRSMTPGERANPKALNGSRRARIARGSGSQVSDVNRLVERFLDAQKMMAQMGKGGIPGMPGLPGMGGPGRAPSARSSARRRARTRAAPAAAATRRSARLPRRDDPRRTPARPPRRRSSSRPSSRTCCRRPSR